jgi:hypothetical protein
MKDACIFVGEDFFHGPCRSVPSEGKIQLATSETKRSQKGGQSHFFLALPKALRKNLFRVLSAFRGSGVKSEFPQRGYDAALLGASFVSTISSLVRALVPRAR